MTGVGFLYGIHAQSADGVRKFSARRHVGLLKKVVVEWIVNKSGTDNYPTGSTILSRFL
jgi:hypothetical protein